MRGFVVALVAFVVTPTGALAQTAPLTPVPPPYVYEPAELGTHAPRYTLWAGGRVSYLAFGFDFYENPNGKSETTGNYVGTGVAPQLDLGVRLARRFVPYVFWEHGFMSQGHRFFGTEAGATTNFYGLGFRYAAGDVDAISFVLDLSIGKRVLTIANGSESYAMSGLELFRLGLGPEIRLATPVTVTPLFSISTGTLDQSEGSIDFNCAPRCVDGINGPVSRNGATIERASAYVAVSLGIGLHLDLFGK